MTEFRENPIPSATYTSVLMNCYNAVIANLNAKQYPQAIKCLETFICALKPNVRAEIKKMLENYYKQLNYIDTIQGIDTIHTIQLQKRAEERLMKVQGYPLLTSITDALDKHGWLNRESNHPIDKANFEEIEQNASFEEL